ncbi:TDP-N-acetylfucosamine:lipid II N-acetylfucosaminyltransferase family protein [Thiomicrolovo sp. ZZH C-3]
MKYLHIMKNEKFIASFITFIHTQFNPDEHLFIILGGVSQEKHPVPDHPNVIVIKSMNSPLRYFSAVKQLKPYFEQAEKVIIHSLLIRGIIDFFFYNLRFCTKAYWVVWGGDLYDYPAKKKKLKRQFYLYKKRQVIKRIAGLITYIRGDYELARRWYGAEGSYHECLMYQSNTYKAIPLPETEKEEICIQVGNSANPTNNHLEILQKLRPYADEKIKIICPLSYGSKQHAKKVAATGKAWFGDKFQPLMTFLPYEEYLNSLAEIDIAVFNHKRQQAMGNIITLLGLGKKVYLRSDISTWGLFEEKGVQLFDSCGPLSIERLPAETEAANCQRIQTLFSDAVLQTQWAEVFQGSGQR